MVAKEIVRKLEATANRGQICYCPLAWALKMSGLGDFRLAAISEATTGLKIRREICERIARLWDIGCKVESIDLALEAGLGILLEAA